MAVNMLDPTRINQYAATVLETVNKVTKGDKKLLPEGGMVISWSEAKDAIEIIKKLPMERNRTHPVPTQADVMKAMIKLPVFLTPGAAKAFTDYARALQLDILFGAG